MAARAHHRLRIVPIAVALAILLLAEVAVGVQRSSLPEPEIWPTPELQGKFGQIRARADSADRPDIVLVGDSTMDAGGDVAALTRAVSGARAYNASIGGETLPVIADWANRIVVPRLHPKVVVIGFGSNELNPRALDDATGLGAYRKSRAVRRAEGRANLVDRADAILRDRSMLYRYRGSIRHPLTQAGKDLNVFDPELTPDGQALTFTGLAYLQDGGPAHAQAVIEGVTAALRGFTVGAENVALLEDMIRDIRSDGARVLLVAMPVTADAVSYHPRGMADHQAAMDAFRLAAGRTGASFAEPGIWPTSLFADPIHLNGAGASELSAHLAPLVQQEVAMAHLDRP